MNQRHGTILGFDFGKKRIGVAVGQTLTASASPLTTLLVHNEQADWDAIGRLIQRWQPVQLVVGLPVNMDGSEHALAATVRNFAGQLQSRYGLAVHLVDERLSSHEAQRIAAGIGGRSAPHSQAAKEAVDRIAAQLILETWLSQQTGKR
jgi:putative Holliday junction resolvase